MAMKIKIFRKFGKKFENTDLLPAPDERMERVSTTHDIFL